MFESFEHYWKHRKPNLDVALRTRIIDLFQHVPTSTTKELYPALDAGKKLRGILLGMIAEEFGGKWKTALPRAVAVELIQVATLIHDDFVDQDRTRRNMPAIWTLEGARRAVLIGDVIFASAINMMSELGRDEGIVISSAIAKISKGALMEPNDPLSFVEHMASKDWRVDTYEKIIHLKTGVLFEAACELGAISTDADEDTRGQCARYGSLIGEAYQMADDIKEIKKHIMLGSISAHQMALLVPAVLCFEKDALPYITPILSKKSEEIAQPFSEYLQSVINLMEIEIQRRLDLAINEVGKVLDDIDNSLCLKAPRELIAMFNLS